MSRESRRFTGFPESTVEIMDWVNTNGGDATYDEDYDDTQWLEIETATGTQRAYSGDEVVMHGPGQFTVERQP